MPKRNASFRVMTTLSPPAAATPPYAQPPRSNAAIAPPIAFFMFDPPNAPARSRALPMLGGWSSMRRESGGKNFLWLLGVAIELSINRARGDAEELGGQVLVALGLAQGL